MNSAYDVELNELIEKLNAIHQFIKGLNDAYLALKKKPSKNADDYKTLNELFKTIREKYREMAKLEEEINKRMGQPV